MKVVNKGKEIDWKNFKFVIFDAPHFNGTFEDRIDYVHSLISADHPYISIIPLEKCRGMHHLDETLDRILKNGGEGVMLRKPGSAYESGRSGCLVKYKPLKDLEAVVMSQVDSRIWECKLYAIVCSYDI